MKKRLINGPNGSCFDNERENDDPGAGRNNKYPSRTPDTDPDAMSGFHLVLSGCALSGPGSGHRVRIRGLSRHSSRQNGESGAPKSRIPSYPAIYPAILRDSPATSGGNGQSCHFSCRNGRRRTKPGQEAGHRGRIPQRPAEVASGLSRLALANRRAWAKAKTCRQMDGIVAELDAIGAEAMETDKALRDIFKQIGVSG